MIKSWSGASKILFIFHHFHPLLISFPLGFEQPSMQLLNDELQCFPELSNYSNFDCWTRTANVAPILSPVL